MNKTKTLIYSALFIAVIYVGGLLKIYWLNVPFTLQTLAVMLTCCFMGAKRGFFVCGAFILMGLIGIPLFTKGGGFSYVIEPTFGYILGFLPACIVGGLLKDRAKNIVTLSLSMFLAGIIMLACGAAYAYILLSLTTSAPQVSVFLSGYFLMFLPAEVLKAAAASFLYDRLKKYIRI